LVKKENTKIKDISLKESNNRWESKSKNWNKIFSDWNIKRDFDGLEAFGAKDYNSGDPEYCDYEICWKETETKFIIRKSEKIMELYKNGDAEVTFFDTLDKWRSLDSGKNLEWKSRYGDIWKLTNFGEIITYKDSLLNRWNIINFGKKLIFTKNNGQRIEKNI
jgi:hypothetical protein